MRLLLRQATRADSAGIWRVRYAVTENTLPPGIIGDADLRREIEDTGRGWVVVDAADEVLAFAIGNAQSGNIWALFVAPEAQGRGHGQRLHDTMLDWLWAQGLQRLWLTTGPETRARRFYEKNGWRDAGRTEKGEILFEQRR